MVQSEMGFAAHVRTYPASIRSSSKKDCERLIDFACNELARTARASAGATGVGQADPLFLSNLQNGLVVGHFNGSVQPFGFVDWRHPVTWDAAFLSNHRGIDKFT